MKIGIIGNGVVGNATAKAWRTYCSKVIVHDRDPARSECALGELLNEADWTFICLPTERPDGRGLTADAVESICQYVAESPSLRNKNYVIKSTVPIGTTRRLSHEYDLPNLVHSPEFLTERTAEEDAENPRINVIGTVGERVVYPPLANLYQERFPRTSWSHVTAEESETLKIVMNAWFATKVAFWNEVRTLTDRLRMDYEAVRDAITDEGRVHGLHTGVPGPDGKFGFGGKCLPSCLAEMIRTMDALDLQPGVMRAAYDRNELLDRPRPTESR